jgi:hypothetical protein
VKDYGFNEVEDVFEVADVVYPGAGKGLKGGSEERNLDASGTPIVWGKGLGALVYKSHRYGTDFTWTIVVSDVSVQGEDGNRDGETQGRPLSLVTLRFRGRIQRTGWQRKVLVWGGGWMDWITTWPMLRGLKERCEDEYRKR